MTRSKMLKVLIVLVGAGAVVFVSVLIAVCVSAGMTWTPAGSDCIIVLGARVWPDGRLSNVLRFRLDAAYEAWQDGVAPVIIACGGQGRTEPEPEGDAMRRYLIARGVPEDCVIPENTSIDTRQNIRNAMDIMAERGMTTAAVCTTNYHMRRALWQARDAGLNATGIAAPSTQDVPSVVRGRLRETCSWILYALRAIDRVSGAIH